MNRVSLLVLITLAYTQQFEYPLTLHELFFRLISPYKDQVSPVDFLEAVRDLLRRGVLQKSGKYYFLRGRAQGVERRQERATLSQKKWQEVDQFLAFIRQVPWVEAVAVTGSLAMNNVVSDEDDVDYMIVTKPQRLWLVRVLVILFAWFKGKRRSWAKEEPNSWCFNLWIEDHQLQKLGERRSLYIAYELCQARFVWDRHRVGLRVLRLHPWVKNMVPFLYGLRLEEEKGRRVASNTRWWELLLSPFLGGINAILWVAQRTYMWPHQTTERVGYSYAFFHPRNTQGLLQKRWKDIIKEYTHYV